MKKKLLFLIFAALISGAFSIWTKAVKEAKLCDSIWTVTYSGSIGTDLGVSVSCTTGGDYKCPICLK